MLSTNSQYDEHHDEGEANYYRDLLMNEPGNPDHVVRWIGEDKAVVVHVRDADLLEIDNELINIPF